ncbi:hypothetical protein PENTCL1PPCAC_27663, partial [Pristionchus entomophagus]
INLFIISKFITRKKHAKSTSYCNNHENLTVSTTIDTSLSISEVSIGNSILEKNLWSLPEEFSFIIHSGGIHSVSSVVRRIRIILEVSGSQPVFGHHLVQHPVLFLGACFIVETGRLEVVVLRISDLVLSRMRVDPHAVVESLESIEDVLCGSLPSVLGREADVVLPVWDACDATRRGRRSNCCRWRLQQTAAASRSLAQAKHALQ